MLDNGFESLNLLSARLIGRFRMALTLKLSANDGQIHGSVRTQMAPDVLESDVPNLERLASLLLRRALARKDAVQIGAVIRPQWEPMKSRKPTPLLCTCAWSGTSR